MYIPCGKDQRFRTLTAQTAADALSRFKPAADDTRWQQAECGGIRHPAGLNGCSLRILYNKVYRDGHGHRISSDELGWNRTNFLPKIT